MLILIQGTTEMPHEMNKEVEDFLYQFETYIQDISEEEFYDAK
jgi:hypothetical protein